jgi:hypothetical protein
MAINDRLIVAAAIALVPAALGAGAPRYLPFSGSANT